MLATVPHFGDYQGQCVMGDVALLPGLLLSFAAL
jgi:hypothetical protein